jgi:hypothetical protein
VFLGDTCNGASSSRFLVARQRRGRSQRARSNRQGGSTGLGFVSISFREHALYSTKAFEEGLRSQAKIQARFGR